MTKQGGGSSDYDYCPRKATQQHCEWLRPGGLEGGIIQVRANRHGLYARASNTGTGTDE